MHKCKSRRELFHGAGWVALVVSFSAVSAGSIAGVIPPFRMVATLHRSTAIRIATPWPDECGQ